MNTGGGNMGSSGIKILYASFPKPRSIPINPNPCMRQLRLSHRYYLPNRNK